MGTAVLINNYTNRFKVYANIYVYFNGFSTCTGMPQLLGRAPQPPVVTSVNRTAPTRPVASPAVVDLARAHSATPAGTPASGRAKGFPALAMQPKPLKAPAPNNSRRPGKLACLLEKEV